jgi:hypothetical protein
LATLQILCHLDGSPCRRTVYKSKLTVCAYGEKCQFRDQSSEVLVLYRERSGGKSFENGEIVRPERFRYSDLKEAVWERSSYGFCMSTSMGTAGRKEN